MNLLEKLWNIMIDNVGTKFISIVIAMVLWIVVLGSRNVEVTKEIPLDIITSPEVVPANEIPEKIGFRLNGPKAFLRAILDRRDEPIRVNLTGSKPGLVTYRFFSDNIRVPIGVKVLSIHPTAILIKLEHLKRKEVPVRVELRGIPPEGYRIVRTEIKPPMIRMRGPESKMDELTEIPTVPIDVSVLRMSMEREVPLDAGRFGVQTDGPLPRIFIAVESTSVVNYRIKNVDIKVISSYQASIEEKTITLQVHASPKDLKSLDRSQTYGVVDLTGRPRGTYMEVVQVKLPPNIHLVKVIPEKVNVTLH